MFNCTLTKEEINELKEIIKYALSDNYGVGYEDIDLTMSIINKIFTTDEINKIKNEYIA